MYGIGVQRGHPDTPKDLRTAHGIRLIVQQLLDGQPFLGEAYPSAVLPFPF